MIRFEINYWVKSSQYGSLVAGMGGLPYRDMHLDCRSDLFQYFMFQTREIKSMYCRGDYKTSHTLIQKRRQHTVKGLHLIVANSTHFNNLFT